MKSKKEMLKFFVEHKGECGDWDCSVCPASLDKGDNICYWDLDTGFQEAKRLLRLMKLEEIKKKHD